MAWDTRFYFHLTTYLATPSCHMVLQITAGTP